MSEVFPSQSLLCFLSDRKQGLPPPPPPSPTLTRSPTPNPPSSTSAAGSRSESELIPGTRRRQRLPLAQHVKGPWVSGTRVGRGTCTGSERPKDLEPTVSAAQTGPRCLLSQALVLHQSLVPGRPGQGLDICGSLFKGAEDAGGGGTDGWSRSWRPEPLRSQTFLCNWHQNNRNVFLLPRISGFQSTNQHDAA